MEKSCGRNTRGAESSSPDYLANRITLCGIDITRIHDRECLEAVFAVQRLGNIDCIGTRAKVVFAELEIRNRNTTFTNFSMREAQRVRVLVHGAFRFAYILKETQDIFGIHANQAKFRRDLGNLFAGISLGGVEIHFSELGGKGFKCTICIPRSSLVIHENTINAGLFIHKEVILGRREQHHRIGSIETNDSLVQGKHNIAFGELAFVYPEPFRFLRVFIFANFDAILAVIGDKTHRLSFILTFFEFVAFCIGLGINSGESNGQCFGIKVPNRLQGIRRILVLLVVLARDNIFKFRLFRRDTHLFRFIVGFYPMVVPEERRRIRRNIHAATFAIGIYSTINVANEVIPFHNRCHAIGFRNIVGLSSNSNVERFNLRRKCQYDIFAVSAVFGNEIIALEIAVFGNKGGKDFFRDNRTDRELLGRIFTHIADSVYRRYPDSQGFAFGDILIAGYRIRHRIRLIFAFCFHQHRRVFGYRNSWDRHLLGFASDCFTRDCARRR